MSSGDWAKIGSSGDGAVVSAIGVNSMIKAKTGSWITLAEHDEEHKPICVKSAMIDGENLLPDVFYTLKNGEFVPVPGGNSHPAAVAQLVEQLSRNQQVAGSNPASGSVSKEVLRRN